MKDALTYIFNVFIFGTEIMCSKLQRGESWEILLLGIKTITDSLAQAWHKTLGRELETKQQKCHNTRPVKSLNVILGHTWV